MIGDVADPEPTLPGLTKESRAEIFGSTYREQCEAERLYPFLAHWAGRYGAAPDHWKAYVVEGRPVPDRREMCVVGEAPIVAAFRSALGQVADPVAWYVVRHVLVACGGQESSGSHRGFPRLPPAPLHLVQLHIPDEAAAAHELGHVWTVDPPAFRSRLSAARCEEITAAAAGLTVLRGELALKEWEHRSNQLERAADELASLWLHRKVDTTSGTCGERRRQQHAREVDRLLERACADVKES